MPIDPSALRAIGARRVTLRTIHGCFTGHVAQSEIPDSAVVIVFAVDGQSGDPLVVHVDSIEAIEQR